MRATTLETLNSVSVKEAVTEPPFTRYLSGPKLMAFHQTPLKLSLPACSVAVERGVKDVTEAALVCTDSRERDGLVFQKSKSREKNPLTRRNKVWGV